MIRWGLAALAFSLCQGAGAAQPALLASAAAGALAQRVAAAGDNGGLPFAVVDKQAALLVVYRGDGRLLGVSPALLGRTVGDDAPPGVGQRAQQGRLLPADSTTPAGRYVAAPGRNHSGEAVVWVDYDAALAIHRLRPDGQLRQRTQRLASGRSDDKRVSAGCVVVPGAFYDRVVQATLGRGRSVVYVMPEHGRWQDLWRDAARGSL